MIGICQLPGHATFFKPEANIISWESVVEIRRAKVEYFTY